MTGTTLRRALLLSGVVGAGLAFAQDSPVIRVDVRLVRILATVKDANGGLVGSLEKSDFTVKDNGAPQEIAVFERQTDQPLSVAILIDNSGSTAKDLKYETDSVLRFLHSLFREGNPGDMAALYSFNWEIVKQNGFSRNVPAFERSLKNLRGEAGTSLYDAILLASRDIQDRQGRKILVVVTDGGDTISRADFQAATEAAQLADAVIYPILVVPIANEAGRNVGGENALTTFALRTGGKVFEPTLGKALDQAFDQILRDLMTQYLIGFYPHDVPLTQDRFHTLEVGVGGEGLQVKARSGYYGEALPAASSAGYQGSAATTTTTGPDESIRKRRPPAQPPAPNKRPAVQN
ncbi:MAG TPA: VWA domain-containing protein [Bryobacteraceae bacterium]|nr:VWA domain-containing protein [Bryobacteraceae bacterium]